TEKASRPPRDLFDSGLPENLKRASRILEKLIGDVPNVTLPTLFENCIRDTGILGAVLKSPDKIWLMQVLTALFDFVKEEARRDPDLGLQRLVQMVDLMKDNGIRLPLVKVAGSDRAVNLLTAHGSKGLEFEYVFFAGCNAATWEKKRKPGGGYKFPDTLFASRSGEGSSPRSESTEEEELRRLFYVAITRVEQHLSISYARYRPDGKELEPSVFIAEILEQHQLPVEKITIPEETLAEFEALPFSDIVAPEIEPAEEGFISRMLEKFVMNVTALNNYLKCPLEFYYKNLVRIPSPKNEATEFGSAVHFALQRLFEKMKVHVAEEFPSKEELLQDFNWYMHRHRESFVKEAFDRRMEYGLEVLGNYYDKY
ncbi:MAG: 3'-5' exonuclease, partial [Bacteroidota bacterium]